MIVSSHRHAQNINHSSRSARRNRESRTVTPWSVRFGESRSANDDTPPHSRTAPLATHQAHTTLQGQRVKPGNRACPHPEIRFGENWVSERRHSLQQVPVVSAKPEGPHRIGTVNDSEPTKRHETRGLSSWLDVVLSRIRLYSHRMSSVSACKHRGALGRSGGRRQAAPSSVGHEGAEGTLRIERDTHPRSLSSKL
jgi:hypothetical protein